MYNSIYPAYVKSYLGVNNRQIAKKHDDEKNSGSSENAENSNSNETRTLSSQPGGAFFPNGERVAIDYTKRQINISQVLSDFKNTTNAIGAPDDIKAEVNSYLGLIESQSRKERPNAQIIQSNLKNASQILDEYITKTLKKPSKVVENWVDALFLQQIDYKAPVSTSSVQTNTSEQLQNIQEELTPQENTVGVEDKQAEKIFPSEIYIPEDSRLKSMFIQAKKYSAIEEKEKALYSFQNVLEYAEEIGDVQTGAMAHYEQGRIYDEFNRIEDALYNYNLAAQQTTDNNVKARAHFSMGKIYDDYVKFEPAVNHYCAAVAFSGEADNLKLQTAALSDLAQIHAQRYDKDNSFMFMDLSCSTAESTKNDKLMGMTYYKNAKNCEKLNEKPRALKLYGQASKAYSSLNDNAHLAKNYMSAAQIMTEYGNSAKARKLLSKAYSAAQKTDDAELKEQIINCISAL